MYYNTTVAYLLWALGGFGALGLQRFYLRKFPTGFLWLFTGGLGMLGSIYDFLTLKRQVLEANARAGYRDAINGRSQTVIIRERYDEPRRREEPKAKESVEKIALRIAQANGGNVSAGEIALNSDYTKEEATKELERLASKGLCELRVRPSGVLVFRFPEFAKDEEGYEL